MKGNLCVTIVFLGVILGAAAEARRPIVELRAGQTVITQSCRVTIPKGYIISDVDGVGAIQIGASNIKIEFVKGSVLRGSRTNTTPDEYRGYGVRVNGHTNVTIRGAMISGYWCGIWATKADGLVLENVEGSDNRPPKIQIFGRK